MRLPRILLIATFFAYFRKVHISHIFPHKLSFSAAILILFVFLLPICLPSVLCRCWLGGRKGIRPVKTEQWGTGVVICLERGADLHMAQLMPLQLTVSCSSKIEIGFTFLVPAYPGCPGKEAVKWL